MVKSFFSFERARLVPDLLPFFFDFGGVILFLQYQRPPSTYRAWMSKKRKFRESEWIFRLFRQRFEGLLYRILAALRIYELVTYSNPQELKKPSVSDKETEGLCNAFRGTTLVDAMRPLNVHNADLRRLKRMTPGRVRPPRAPPYTCRRLSMPRMICLLLPFNALMYIAMYYTHVQMPCQASAG